LEIIWLSEMKFWKIFQTIECLKKYIREFTLCFGFVPIVLYRPIEVRVSLISSFAKRRLSIAFGRKVGSFQIFLAQEN
jgi:hypothetical protein